MKSRHICVLVALSCLACSEADSTFWTGFARPVTKADSVTMSAERGPLITRDSLLLIDQKPAPCCATDSAGVQVQVTGGTLNFFAAASYGEMMSTPGGSKPVACVQGVPGGAIVGGNYVVTLGDGTNYLMLPCTAGYFTITLTEQIALADGSSTTRQVTLATGRYGWERNRLSLTEQGTASGAIASMSGAMITVTVPYHHYVFVALSRF